MLIWIIAIANAVLWTGLFVLLLFTLMRGQKDINARLEEIESRVKSDRRK